MADAVTEDDAESVASDQSGNKKGDNNKPAGAAVISSGLSEDVHPSDETPKKRRLQKEGSISDGDSDAALSKLDAGASVPKDGAESVASDQSGNKKGDNNKPAGAAVISSGLSEEITVLDDASTEQSRNEERLWRRAVLNDDCVELGKLLAKDVSFFWKYEKKNSKTALHAAATKGDLILAEHVLDMLSWAEESEVPKFYFWNSGLLIVDYIAATTEGRTAEQVARDNNQAGIRNKILDYIANDTQRRTYKERRMAATGSSSNQRVRPENLEWNEAMKKKDCQALLKLLRDEKGNPSSNGYELIKLDVSKAKSDLKYGKGERRTMLHVAAMQGCFPLARLVLDMLGRFGGRGSRGLYINAVDDLSGLTAFEMANDIIGNRSISEYLKDNTEGSIKHKLQVKTENDDYRIHSCGRLISFEAYPDTRWYMALERGDTKELKKLLELNSRFVLETCHGMTVLHVAILWDDLELVKAVVKLFEDKSKRNTKKINWGDSYYPSSLKHYMMNEARRNLDHRYLNEYWDASARQWDILVPDILKQIKKVKPPSSSTSLNFFGVGGINSCRRLAELLNRLEIQKLYLEDATPTPIVDNGEYSTMPLRLRNFFKETWEKSPQWKDGEFRKDVDFNFEDSKRQGWLKFHYACKDPVKFKDLLQKMASFINVHPYDGIKLFQTWDAKGRTPFHILMDHCSDQQDPGWPFDEV
ncbi:hypothetical protein M758_12G162800 [Ceratodon purpureus]|nr:hypothetical protein M758_12G162800 [Ceratodon purpureus]